MTVLLLQLDGKLPNIALMRIAAHSRPYADDITFQHCPTVKAVEASDWWGFDRIYASLIFERTRPVAEALLQQYRFAEVGGTGWDGPNDWRTSASRRSSKTTTNIGEEEDNVCG